MKHPDQELDLLEIDLFKADIYSLGITLIEAATAMNIRFVNDSEKELIRCEEALEKTKLP